MSAKHEVLLTTLRDRVETLEALVAALQAEIARLQVHSPDALRRPVGRPRKEGLNGSVRD